jgi:ferric-dicitrate binding protein FerR (iron transport regulator)
MVQQNTGTSDQVVRKQNTFKEKTPTITISPMHNLEADNTSYETSWIKNKLSFDGESLEQVALKIERWFGVKVAINNDRLKKEVFTGLYEDESLSEVLAALQLSGKFHYSINRKEVSIWP